MARVVLREAPGDDPDEARKVPCPRCGKRVLPEWLELHYQRLDSESRAEDDGRMDGVEDEWRRRQDPWGGSLLDREL